MTKISVFKPEHYADMLILAVEKKHTDKKGKGNFLNLAIYRDQVVEVFEQAVTSAYEAGKRKGRVDLEEAQIHDLKGNI